MEMRMGNEASEPKFLHVSGCENRAMRRALIYTGAGKKINPLTGLTALQEAGPRVPGATYNIGRNAKKREKAAKARKNG